MQLWGCFKGTRSESSTSSTTGSSGGIGRDGGDILDSSDLESVTGESSDGRLGSGSRSLGVDTTSSSELDVDGVDSDGLEGSTDVDGGEHSYKQSQVRWRSIIEPRKGKGCPTQCHEKPTRLFSL